MTQAGVHAGRADRLPKPMIAQEARARPGTDGEPDRAEAVRATASQPVRWLDHLSKKERRELGELAERLPMLVFHHAVGRSTDELVQRFGGWSSWRYDRALEVACG